MRFVQCCSVCPVLSHVKPVYLYIKDCLVSPCSFRVKSTRINPHSRQIAVLTKIPTNFQVEGESLSFLVTSCLKFQFPFLNFFFFLIRNLYLDFGAKRRTLNETELLVLDILPLPIFSQPLLLPMLLISQCPLGPPVTFLQLDTPSDSEANFAYP